MDSIIDDYALSAPQTSVRVPTSDWNDVWQREEAADQGSRLLLAIAADLSLDDLVLDLDDYIN